jgi:hypothetical protein
MRLYRPRQVYTVSISPSSDNATLTSVPVVLLEFLKTLDPSTPCQVASRGVEISYDPRTHWQGLSDGIDAEKYFDFLAEHEKDNSRAIAVNMNGKLCMFSVTTAARPKLIKGIVDRVRYASEQLSGDRSGLIWVHFAGIPEPQFRWLSQHAKEATASPFNVVSNYILRNESRNHVAAIWYSATGGSPSESSTLRGERIVRGSGPVYQARSFKSKFVLPNGLANPN